MSAHPMTRAERDDLIRLAKMRERTAKRRTSDMAADFETKLASHFSFDQRAGMVRVDGEGQGSRRRGRPQTRRLGIPANFWPEISVHWYGRGENATAQRRTELRRVMLSRLAALERAAVETIERGSLEFITKLVGSGLGSDAARALLSAMPSIEQLMPQLDYTGIQRSLLEGPEATALRAAGLLTDDSDGGAS